MILSFSGTQYLFCTILYYNLIIINEANETVTVTSPSDPTSLNPAATTSLSEAASVVPNSMTTKIVAVPLNEGTKLNELTTNLTQILGPTINEVETTQAEARSVLEDLKEPIRAANDLKIAADVAARHETLANKQKELAIELARNATVRANETKAAAAEAVKETIDTINRMTATVEVFVAAARTAVNKTKIAINETDILVKSATAEQGVSTDETDDINKDFIAAKGFVLEAENAINEIEIKVKNVTEQIKLITDQESVEADTVIKATEAAIQQTNEINLTVPQVTQKLSAAITIIAKINGSGLLLLKASSPYPRINSAFENANVAINETNTTQVKVKEALNVLEQAIYKTNWTQLTADNALNEVKVAKFRIDSKTAAAKNAADIANKEAKAAKEAIELVENQIKQLKNAHTNITKLNSRIQYIIGERMVNLGLKNTSTTDDTAMKIGESSDDTKSTSAPNVNQEDGATPPPTASSNSAENNNAQAIPKITNIVHQINSTTANQQPKSRLPIILISVFSAIAAIVIAASVTIFILIKKGYIKTFNRPRTQVKDVNQTRMADSSSSFSDASPSRR